MILQIAFCCLATRYDRHEPYHLITHFKRNDVNVVIDYNEEEPLPRIFPLIWVVCNPPNVSPSEMDNNGFEAQISCPLEEVVFLGIPVILHSKSMPYRHTFYKRLFSYRNLLSGDGAGEGGVGRGYVGWVGGCHHAASVVTK